MKDISSSVSPAHTPTPWTLDGFMILGTAPKGWKGTPNHPRFIVAQAGIYVSPKTDEQLENAAFIVRAVNAHEELLNALRLAHDFIRQISCVPDPKIATIRQNKSLKMAALGTIESAIAKAEVK